MAIPGPPVMDAETAAQVRDLMAKGFAGTVFLTTDDCRAAYQELRPAVSSSWSHPRNARTASIWVSVTRRATPFASPRSGRWRDSEHAA